VTWQGVHWLTGTCSLPPTEVADTVSRHLYGLHLEEIDRGLWTYRASAIERSTKARVLWTPGRLDVAVNLPGEACELLGTEGVLALVRELGLKITRLDLAWDTDLFSPKMVSDVHEQGFAVTFSRYSKWIKEKGQKNSGSTFYIGKRASDPDVRLVRFYDRRGPTRVELELHGKRAQMLWGVLDGLDLEEWSPRCLAYLVDFVDFRDRVQDSNVGRCDRLPWWEDFTSGAGRLALPLPRKAPTLSSTQDWIESQVAPALSLVADYVPDATAWLRAVLADGKDRRRPHHSAMLAAVRVLDPASFKVRQLYG
jgi:DNA relaxase NicK